MAPKHFLLITNAIDPAFTGPTDNGFASGFSKLEYIATHIYAARLANTDEDSSPVYSERLATRSVKDAQNLIWALQKSK